MSRPRSRRVIPRAVEAAPARAPQRVELEEILMCGAPLPQALLDLAVGLEVEELEFVRGRLVPVVPRRRNGDRS